MGLRIRIVAVALICGMATGCDSDSGRVPLAQVVDSAGVRVLSYDLTATSVPAFRVVGEADLEIGVRSGAPEYSFSRVADLTVTSDGSIVVSDAQGRELRVFDREGSYKLTLGGPGDGPGEFATAPTIAGAAGDTVFAFDQSHRRVTSFTLAGELVAATTLGSTATGGPGALLRQGDGTYLAPYPWVSVGGSDATPHDVRLELDSIAILRLDSKGQTLDTVRVMADRERLRVVQAREGGRVSVMQTVTPWATQAFVRSDGMDPIVARSDSFSYAKLSPTGAVRLILKVRGVQNPATAEDIRAFQEAALSEAFGDDPIDPMVRRINLDYLPDRLPAFANVLVSPAGDVWVALTEFDSSNGYDWLVFADDGELRGLVHTPPKFRLFRVIDDHVFGVVSDELDVQYVRAFPLLLPVPAEEG